MSRAWRSATTPYLQAFQKERNLWLRFSQVTNWSHVTCSLPASCKAWTPLSASTISLRSSQINGMNGMPYWNSHQKGRCWLGIIGSRTNTESLLYNATNVVVCWNTTGTAMIPSKTSEMVFAGSWRSSWRVQKTAWTMIPDQRHPVQDMVVIAWEKVASWRTIQMAIGRRHESLETNTQWAYRHSCLSLAARALLWFPNTVSQAMKACYQQASCLLTCSLILKTARLLSVHLLAPTFRPQWLHWRQYILFRADE